MLPTVRASALEALHRETGLLVEIEAGPVGLVVYGPSVAAVRAAAVSLVRSARTRDPKAELEPIGDDADEPAETRFYGVVRFDWAKF